MRAGLAMPAGLAERSGVARLSMAGALALSAGAAAAQQPPAPAGPREPWPAAPAMQARPTIELTTLNDMGLAMEMCWRASLPARPVPGMTINVMVSFKRNGEIFGEPKFTFVTPGVPTDTRATYQRAAADAIARCNPLPFSESLGNAAAGRPWVFHFTDRRNEKGT